MRPSASTQGTQACARAVQYEYLWADGVKVKKPMKLPAPQYVDTLFDWIEEQVRSLMPCQMHAVVMHAVVEAARVCLGRISS